MIPDGGTPNTIEAFRSAEGGVLLVDKPEGWTSFDVIRKLRGVLQIRKIGHAGTLDPLATGLLILASGGMTRSIDRFQAMGKTYVGAMRLGGVTASYDAATPVTDERPTGHLTPDALRDAARGFIGTIAQVPPMFSALKKDGRRLYELARAGRDVERAPRDVEIERFDILTTDMPDATFRVVCSKGTYVRSLVHDLGQALGCGAYLTALRRTAIGGLRVEDAWTLERIAAAAGVPLQSRAREAAHAGH